MTSVWLLYISVHKLVLWFIVHCTLLSTSWYPSCLLWRVCYSDFVQRLSMSLCANAGTMLTVLDLSGNAIDDRGKRIPGNLIIFKMYVLYVDL